MSQYQKLMNDHTNLIFRAIENDINRIISYAEESQDNADDVLCNVVAELKGLKDKLNG